MVIEHGHWTLTWRGDLISGIRCLCRIIGYYWYDFVSNQRLFCDTNLRPFTSIVHQCQLWYATLLIRLSPKGLTQHGGGLGDSHITYVVGREFVWRLARHDHQEWCHRVGKAMHPMAYAPPCLLNWKSVKSGSIYSRVLCRIYYYFHEFIIT